MARGFVDREEKKPTKEELTKQLKVK